ncbi:MAG: DUF2927 domain-containing protein [Pseudomonadota bacterium]
MRRLLLFPLCMMLAACMSAPQDVSSRAATPSQSSLPAMKTFGASRPTAPDRSNRDIARDFLELSFQLESGRQLQQFSRFEGPIAVQVTGNPPPTLMPDLNRLVNRLRNEAGIDIATRQPTGPNPSTITIEVVSRADIRRFLPKAACFVVPNVSSLREYRSARHTAQTNWSSLARRTQIAIFLPGDAAPQEVRDCLHEELAQALGPLNDLYRLPDSVFNDDNVHTVLTGFDMLILRAYYAPELQSGMTQSQVAQRIPAILSRLNPRGNALPSRNTPQTPRAWIRAVQTALGPDTNSGQRRRAASEALRIAQTQGWTDHRLGFSHFALARLSQVADPEVAFRNFVAAEVAYRRAPGTRLHQAYSASQLAAYAISQGQGNDALVLLNPHIATAERFENAALLSTLLMLRAEALVQVGRTAEANAVRMDSLGWARYGFGTEWAVRAKLREITALSPVASSQ